VGNGSDCRGGGFKVNCPGHWALGRKREWGDLQVMQVRREGNGTRRGLWASHAGRRKAGKVRGVNLPLKKRGKSVCRKKNYGYFCVGVGDHLKEGCIHHCLFTPYFSTDLPCLNPFPLQRSLPP